MLFCGSSLAQISPGPLAKAHQQMNGPAGCMQCHSVSTRSPNFRCLECHRDIAARVQQRKGLHATFVSAGAPGSACVKCHSDHNGENFQLVKWDPSPRSFDHSKTGFALDGKHAGVACRSCHTAQRISPAERAMLTAKDLNHTYLGLTRSCVNCHEDKHKGSLGANCLQCHNTTDWKAAQQIDHSKTRFPLTGAHVQVACQKCHTPGPDGAPRYFGLKFDYCADCHRDPHHGAFKQSCESCHNTRSWQKSAFTSTFDHSRTRFPLLGKHLQVACEICHAGADFKRPIAHQFCADCHKPDPHNGQFARRPDGGKCESCHRVEGWRPSTFTVKDHLATAYPLPGKHASVACAQCHIPAGRNTLFKIKFALCTDCHKDTHQGQFARAPYQNRCELCHTDITFHPSTFTLARHQKTQFVLTGSHLAVPCVDCHKPMRTGQATAFHFNGLTCTTCHTDPHRGEFAIRMSKVRASGTPLGCEACHTTKEWKDLTAFDHSTTSFLLTGAHRAVPCAGCHRPPNMEQSMLHVSFKAVSSHCEDCHENPHASQFAKAGGVTRCAECHNSTKWKPSLFDHERTIFPLKGGHQNVKCSACHNNLKDVNGKQVLFYKPTPTACSACHGANISSLDPKMTRLQSGRHVGSTAL